MKPEEKAAAAAEKTEVVDVNALAPARKSMRQLYKQFADEGKEFVPCRIVSIVRDVIGDGETIRPVAYVTLEPTSDTELVRGRNVMSLITLNNLAQSIEDVGAIADYLNEHPEALCMLLAGCTAKAVQIPHTAGETVIDPLSGREFTPKTDGVTLYLFDLEVTTKTKERIERIVDKVLFG